MRPLVSPVRQALRLVLPYWRSRALWRALPLVAVMVTALAGSTYVSLAANRLAGALTDALVQRNWALLASTLWATLGFSLLGIALAVGQMMANSLLQLDWRTWLTDGLLRRWLDGGAFYAIERDDLLGNADQRIADDLNQFIEVTLQLVFSIVMALVQSVTYGVLLWELSGALDLSPWGWAVTVPGYLLVLAVVWTGVNLGLVHLTGRAMIPLNAELQNNEGNFRFGAMQAREAAEQIAFYRGGARERSGLNERFAALRHSSIAVTLRSGLVTAVDQFYGQFLQPIATLAVLPRYVAGQITLGGITQTTGAFGLFVSTLSVFSQTYRSIARWLALARRLGELSQAIDAGAAPGDRLVWRRDESAGASQAVFTSDALSLQTRRGATITTLPPQRFALGEHWLIRGSSGCGKSTLLRALAGLWPHGEGRIVAHLPAADMLFIPQRSYLPEGSLAAAVTYPAAPAAFSDDRLWDALQRVGLGHLCGSLQEVDQWRRRLSGGEQQRLALARAFLHRPRCLIMDEATSALDEASERAIYAELKQAFGDDLLISVAHRSNVFDFHDHRLDMPERAGAG